MDCWEEVVFKGYSTGESWNGWAKPVFELAEAQRIVALINEEEPFRGTYDEKTDIFTIEDHHGEPAEIIKGAEITAGGKKIKTYAIGTGSWTWQEAPKPKPEDEDD
jgi:hypothetical protein